MARTTGPLMSMEASGTLAKTLVYSRWKGRAYVRRWTIPANPKSPLQVSTRAMMTFLSQTWASIGTPAQASWEAQAESMKISPFNAFVRANQKRFANFDPPITSYGDNGGFSQGAVGTITPTVDNRLVTISVAFTPGSTDWGGIICLSDSVIAACTRGLVAKVSEAMSSPFTAVLGPLLPATYHVNARTFGLHGDWSADGTDTPFTVT